MTVPAVLTATVRIAAPPADVFPYFVDPALMIQWIGGWSSPGVWRARTRSPPGSTTVEVVLTADGPNTIVELFHHDLPAEEFDSHLKGWRSMLDRLVRLRT